MTKLEKAKEIVRQRGGCTLLDCDYGFENECSICGRCVDTDLNHRLKEAEKYISKYELKRGDWVYVSDESEEDALNQKRSES